MNPWDEIKGGNEEIRLPLLSASPNKRVSVSTCLEELTDGVWAFLEFALRDADRTPFLEALLLVTRNAGSLAALSNIVFALVKSLSPNIR